MTQLDPALLPLINPLAALLRLLGRFDNRGVIIGGIAASLLGKPRLTADIDAVFLLSLSQLPDLLEAASQEGLEPRVSDVIEFARRSHVVVLKHAATGITYTRRFDHFEGRCIAPEGHPRYSGGSCQPSRPGPEARKVLGGTIRRCLG